MVTSVVGGMVEAQLDSLKLFKSIYTASVTVTATSTCGSTQPINIAFMTSRGQSMHILTSHCL